MKVKTMGVWAISGMMLASAGAWSLASAKPKPGAPLADPLVLAEPKPAPAFSGAEFSTGHTVVMDGRLGHVRLLADKDSLTYVLVNLTAASTGLQRRAPLNLAIVIDRSGSMKGRRLSNALQAAAGMIQRLEDGDAVSVVTYSGSVEVVLPSTSIDERTRASAIAALDSIRANGETCISCGVEAGARMLQARSGMVDRVLLLSDGEATAGIRDLAGFRALAGRIRERGASISSIGVDVEYNERTLAALAQESNGRHHFVENPAALAQAFDAELETLSRTVAKDAELTLDLAPGVHVEEVYDRTFRRESGAIVVPFGTFAAGEQKTLLVRVRVESGSVGERAIASAHLSFADVGSGSSGQCTGTLSLIGVRDASQISTLDPSVLARLQRSETARTLTEANQLFSSGQSRLAKRRLADKLDDLRRERKSAVLAAPRARATEIEGDFARQERALGAAVDGFAEPPPSSASVAGGAPAPSKPEELRKGKAQVRSNQQQAVDLAF